MILGIIIAVLVIACLFWGISTNNRLVRLRNKVENSWAQIDVQLKRRADLIPNVLEVVKGYAAHEKDTLERVIQARNNYLTASSQEAQIEASNGLTGALGRLFALGEAYPDLKANANFINLQNELSETENKIAYARQFYNDDVTQYRNLIEMFPSSVVADLRGFKPYPYYQVNEEDQAVPHISF
ncbi:MAG: LemA family protein [bacterium]